MQDPVLILARFVLYGLALGLAGVPLYLWLTGAGLPRRHFRPAYVVAALLAIVASLLAAATAVTAMAAMPLGSLDLATFTAVAEATPVGTVLDIRLVAYALLIIGALVFPRNWALAAIAVVALGTHALTGHAGAGEGTAGHVQRVLDVTHLIGAALWFGALLAFLGGVLGRGPVAPLVERLEGFARIGTAVVAVLAVTGAINGWLIVRGGFALDSDWSLLLVAKLCLFGVMLACAGLNRWKLTPAFAAGMPGARGRLMASLTVETLCAIGIFAVVAWLGMADPSGM